MLPMVLSRQTWRLRHDIQEAKRMRRVVSVLLVLALLTGVLGVTSVAAAATTEFPRSQTLYTGGKQWGPPSNWNPFMTGNYATGTIGLCYDCLLYTSPSPRD